MAVTTNTPARLVFTAGELTVGGVSVGATMEGNVLRWEKEVSTPHFHGVRGPLAQGMFMNQFIPYLETTVPELIGANIVHALPGVTLASNASSEVISGFVPGCLASTAFKTVVLTITKCSGKTQVITLYNAIMVEAGEITYNDEGEPATLRLVFMGTYDPANPTVAPLTIVNNIL